MPELRCGCLQRAMGYDGSLLSVICRQSSAVCFPACKYGSSNGHSACCAVAAVCHACSRVVCRAGVLGEWCFLLFQWGDGSPFRSFSRTCIRRFVQADSRHVRNEQNIVRFVLAPHLKVY